MTIYCVEECFFGDNFIETMNAISDFLEGQMIPFNYVKNIRFEDGQAFLLYRDN